MPDDDPPPTDNQVAIAAAHRRGEVAFSGRAGNESIVRRFLDDPDAKVRVAALAALVRMGKAVVADINRFLTDRDPGVRRSACELAAHVPASLVATRLDDPDPRVVEAAAFALGELEESDATPALAVVARTHDDALCRESAVAALGAIGDERGRHAVLSALGDVPAVRRRAVVALAAFDGEDVDAALRERLTDRDWQVRQAAEDVLGITDEEPR